MSRCTSLKVEIMWYMINWVPVISWPSCNYLFYAVIKRIKWILNKPPSNKFSLTSFVSLEKVCQTDHSGSGAMMRDSLQIST